MRTTKAVFSALATYGLPVAVIGFVAWPSEECRVTSTFNALSGNRSPADTIPLASITEKPDFSVTERSKSLAQPEPEPFAQTNRPGSVDLEATYNLTGLTLPREQIHTLLPKDAIPSLTDPPLESVSAAGDWLQADDRVVAITIGSESIAVPLKILTYHEIANMTIGGQAIAATYCPLCDSVTLISREITLPSSTADDAEPETLTLEFGVSGALYNSNVLMYDKQTNSLWSQLGLAAVSGPHVGTGLTHLPVRVFSFGRFALEHPRSRVVSRETGHDRPYEGEGYAGYFTTDNLLVDVYGSQRLREDLPKKTLGLGIRAGDQAWFVTADVLADGYTLETPLGPVTARRTGTDTPGIEVLTQPASVATSQTFYYAWASFFPDLQLVLE